MVKHVILWKLKDEIEDKSPVKAGIKAGLEGLKGVVPGLVDIAVRTEGLASSNADVMLDSTFESEEALKGYSVHFGAFPGIFRRFASTQDDTVEQKS